MFIGIKVLTEKGLLIINAPSKLNEGCAYKLSVGGQTVYIGSLQYMAAVKYETVFKYSLFEHHTIDKDRGINRTKISQFVLKFVFQYAKFFAFKGQVVEKF